MREDGKKKKSLKKNFFFNFTSQILTLIVPLITMPYLSRILHEKGNGQIAFSNNIITYFTMIANLGYSVYGQREIAKYQDNKEERSKVFWEIIIIRICLSLFSTALLLILNSFNIFGETYTTLIYIFGIQVIAIAFDVNYYYQGIEDFKSIAIRTIVLRLVCLVCIFTFVKTENDIWVYALIYSASVLFSNMIMWPKLRKEICFIPLKKLEFKHHFLPALIIFLPTLTATIYGSLDKLMIGYLTSNPDYENGCYNQALKLNQTILIVITVIDSIMIARNSADFASGNKDRINDHIKFSCNYVTHLGLPMIAGMIVLAQNLCSWFLGDGFAEVPLLLSIMSIRFIVSGLACVFGNQLFIAIGKEKYTTIAHVFTAIFNLVLNFIFIPLYGAVGGAITTAAAETLDCVILFAIAVKKQYIRPKDVFLPAIKPLLSSILMFGCVYFIQTKLNYSIWSFILITLLGVIIYGILLLCLRDSFVLENLKKIISSIFKKNKEVL